MTWGSSPLVPIQTGLISLFNPLNPNIKIQILICYAYTFSVEEVGRIC